MYHGDPEIFLQEKVAVIWKYMSLEKFISMLDKKFFRK
jgi:hypothetical protein